MTKLKCCERTVPVFRAPEDEEEISHINLTLRFALITFGLVPFSLFLLAIWVSAHPHITEIDMNPNFTQYVRSTFQYNETGNGEIWVYDDDGSTINLKYHWNPFYIMNMTHYSFGHGNDSFCNTRNESFEHNWSTSIFRATQLYSSVQTGMRYGLLLVMLPMILNAYVIAKSMFIEQKTLASFLIGFAYLCNELLVHVSYFLLTALHVVFDEKYIPYSTFYFSFAMFTSMSKLILRNFTETLGLSSLIRSIGVMILIISYSPLEKDILDYAENVYCDTFAAPKVCVLQLLCIIVLFFNNLYDTHKSKCFKIVVSSTADECCIQPIPKNSVFRR